MIQRIVQTKFEIPVEVIMEFLRREYGVKVVDRIYASIRPDGQLEHLIIKGVETFTMGPLPKAGSK